ncbi:MAG: translation initiation factor IF-2 N-terminal domain-containing protein, partial [Deltaproteobacteria bacterium]|nr:translation initiation factor IF-2 N-terminal domain-containing protein [Deltaproteobacteria bacterium]
MTLEKVKVYELAKELGMDSITLIDKLKQLDIDVKSHMSSLETEEVKLVKESVAKEKAVLSKIAKTAKTTKKKAETATTEAAAPKRAGTTVIRRRAKSSDEAAAPETTSETALPADAAAPTPAEETQVEQIAAETAAPAAETDQPSTEAPARAAAPAATAAPTAAKPAAPAHVPLKGSGLKMHTLLGSRSEGIAPAKTSSILNIVKEEPRRAPPPRVAPNVRPNVPGQMPQVTPRGPGSGITTLGKDQIDRLVEEENTFKKKGGAGRNERGNEPTAVKISDYRAKKELVFLPKKKKVPVNKEIKHTTITKPAQHKRKIRFENTITVAQLADAMGVKAGELMKKLITQGMMVTINHPLDFDTATLLAHEYQYEVENVAFKES